MAPGRAPNLSLERTRIGAGHMTVAGSDEVGRGALGGPVTAGVVIVEESTRRQPGGLRSKLLSPAEREALVPRIERWAVAFGVGHASASEIDQFGILRALRLAGERALACLPALPDLVILDGNYDWFTRPAPARTTDAPASSPEWRTPPVELRVKADLTCSSVAAASVLAKVERDQLMREMAVFHPEYGWDENKGYATPRHIAALRERGPCSEHRLSWRLGCEQRLFSPDDLGTVLTGPVLAGAAARPGMSETL